MNLILDPWIPVVSASGWRIIRPDQIGEAGILFPDWPRADLNIACLELLIGLVALADPPDNPEEWEARRAPDPDRLRERLVPFASAFELGGDGPRFLQELGPLTGAPAPPDMLFIDSAGENAAKKNADLMVWRDRYPVLEPALAAMALYTLQAYTPAGGAGNRTSMRGGGPLVTLVEPRRGCSLWELVWANVPCGRSPGIDALPWTRPTRVSDAGQVAYPPSDDAIPLEAFFGMPRRLRLVFDNEIVTGVIQRPFGTNYGGWQHPLTPYYRLKAGTELLPQHPRAGAFGYRNWLGVVTDAPDTELRVRAASLRAYPDRVPARDQPDARVIVCGWAMDNMKPRDFVLSHTPLLALDRKDTLILHGMIEAAEAFGGALRQALKPVVGEGTALDNLREEFFLRTQGAFEARLTDLRGGAAIAEAWLADMRKVAFAIFDAAALPGLADLRIGPASTRGAGAVVAAREFLRRTFRGYGKFGRDAFTKLQLALPATRKLRGEAA